MSKRNSLIVWHVYLVKIPYYDVNISNYTFKARPSIFYKDVGEDAVFLPITSNQNLDGTKKKEPNIFQVEVKFQKFGLVKVNQPISVSKKAIIIHKNFGFKVPMNNRRSIIKAWSKLMNWPLNK